MLPVIAVLHVRHDQVRDSGAMLGTIIGMVVVASASACPPRRSSRSPRCSSAPSGGGPSERCGGRRTCSAAWLGAVTLGLAVGEFALVLALGPLGADMSIVWLPLRVLLGFWMLALSVRAMEHARTRVAA